MKLITESVLFVLLLCCYFCCCNTASDTCWVDCPKSQKNLSESVCFLKDDGTSSSCLGDLSGYENLSVMIDLTSAVRELEIVLSSINNLEIGALRSHPEIVYLRIGRGNALISRELYYLLPELTHLHLEGVKFQMFPSISDSNPLLTYLQVNAFYFINPGDDSVLRKGCVSGLAQLNTLELLPDQILTTTDDSFSGLTALRILMLRQVHVPNPVATFSPLVNLINLEYRSSNLTDISFLSLTPSLYGLILLSFIDNTIVHIPSNLFLNYSNLSRLELSYNEISALEPDYFHGLGNLTNLDLEANQLKELSTTIFGGLEFLFRIDLSYNQISHLFFKTFEPLRHLGKLYLTGLPLCCDCCLQWLTKTTAIIYNPICATPLQWHGKYAKNQSIYVNCPPESAREGIITL